MTEARVQRRLAAIMTADVVGFSRLMGEDESGTLAALKHLRASLVDPAIDRCHGRIVKLMGDGALVEFASVVDAVECAVDIQRSIAEQQNNKEIKFRIGINLGDVIIDGDDIYGDGVNVAARLEGLAEPGGVCISGTVFDQVKGKLDVLFEDLGPREVKNIAEPVRVYQVTLTTDTKAPIRELPLPDKPSIAVLPFDNMSRDPEQEFFSDGITEDIITALSQIRQFFVIARNTTFTYKGRAVDVQAVAKELGVRYLLEGSIRQVGNRIRVTAQLIDGETGNHLWADRYDRDLEDIFAVQDEITTTVVGAIEPELSRAEQARARLKNPENLDAWGLYHQGVWNIWQTTKKHHLEAKRLFRRAIELDSEFCAAYAYLGFSLFRSVPMGLTDTPEEDLREALLFAKRAIAIDQGNALAHMAMGAVHMQTRNHELAQRALERAIEINPCFALAYNYLGWTLVFNNQPEEGIHKAQESQRLSPNDPTVWGMILIQAQGNINLKNFDKAEELARQSKSLAETFPANCAILASVGYTGNTEDAEKLINEVLEARPDFTATKIESVFPFKYQADIDIWVEGLRRAGVPEG